MKKFGFGVLLILGFALGGMRRGRADDPAKVQELTKAFQAQACLACHGDIHKEWFASRHAQAWKNPTYKATRQRIGEAKAAQECDHCHAPQPIYITGIDQMPKLRADDRDSGVNCLTCHLDADGAMRGPHGGTSPFHKTKADPTLKSVDTCAPCHGQPSVPQHDEVTGFKKGLGSKGITCHTCHMPAIERQAGLGENVPKRANGQHTWPGGYTDAMVKNAATVQTKVEDGKVTVRITNNAGHPLPGATYRTLVLSVRVTDDNNKTVLNKQEIFFKSPNPQQQSANKRIGAGETYTFSAPITAESGTARVRLVYQRPDPAAPLTQVQPVVIADKEETF